ncbi:MAG: mechanosensitive ion channel [Alphaproteobacteria bacterium]|nr:mechanosensitive ion channel [Alphaproteobacteria bacterium]
MVSKQSSTNEKTKSSQKGPGNKLSFSEYLTEVLSRVFLFTMKHTVIVVSVCLLLYAFTYLPDFKTWLNDLQSESTKVNIMRSMRLDVLAKAIIFLLITLNVFKFLKNFVGETLLKHASVDAGVRYSISVLIGYLGWVVATWGVLSIFGLNMDNLAMFFGALSVGLGFGLQHIVNNFFSGVLILFERPIKKGDWVNVNGKEGIVTNIKIRSTELKTFDETSVVIPNADILSNSLVNMTHTDVLGRVVINVGVSYDSDLHKVQQILFDCGKRHPNAEPGRDPSVFLREFGDSSINFSLMVVISDVMKKLATQSDIMFDIYDSFEKEGIEIPFPQRVVHIKEKK